MAIQTRNAKRLQRLRRLTGVLLAAQILIIIADVFISRWLFGA